nr:hypothetical protein [Spirosomataceae bacterium]
ILVEAFGLQTLYEPTPLLKEWLTIDKHIELNEHEKYLLHQVHQKLIKNMSHWNEEELKMNFISMMMLLAYFDDPIKTYYDREISATIGDVLLSCKSDMMLSKGIGEMIKTLA